MVASVLVVVLAAPASASEPMTFDRMIGSPRMLSPQGVAIDASGDAYVSVAAAPNTTPGDEIVKYDADGGFLDVIAGPGTGNGQVWDPSAITFAPNGDLYVAEMGNDRVQRFDTLGNFLGTWGGTGSGNGQFFDPRGIAVDSLGDVYVADTGNNRVQKFDASGNWLTAWATSSPTGIAVDSGDVVWVVGSTVQRFGTDGSLLSSFSPGAGNAVSIDASDHAWVAQTSVVKLFDATGALLDSFGTSGSGNGQVSGPKGVAVAPGGNVFVADTGNNRVQRFSSGTYETAWGRYPGPGVPDFPTGLAVDGSDNVYITNKGQDQIQEFDSSGLLLREFGGSGNTNGKLNDPAAVAVASSGDVFVADTKNERIQVFDSSGVYKLQWGSFGTADGQLKDPAGIAVDGSGNVYVADTANNRIQKFGPSGLFLLTWGSLGTGDGQFTSPRGIAIDGSGNVWVADTSNHRIQEFTSTGTFMAKWGASGTADGRLSSPQGLAFDGDGTLWVSDFADRVQRFSTTGGFLSRMGSLGLGVGEFDNPAGIAFDSAGRLLVADTNNHRVQVFVDKNGPDVTIISAPASVSGSSSATFTFQANEPNSTYECKLDGGSYSACSGTKTYNGVAEGSHSFSVRATDELSNVGNPTVYPWTVDVTPPTVNITSSPAVLTASTSAQFAFTASEPGAVFSCALDSASPAGCTSPKAMTVSATAHTFHVTAMDLAGNVGPTASYSWTVDNTPPAVTITSGPNALVASTTATFKFTSSDTSATFTCKLDGLDYAGCASPKTYSGVAGGAHSFLVRGTDSLGNVGTPATWNWTVDAEIHRPDAQIATGTTYVGNGVYNTTGSSQTKTLKAASGNTVTFKIRIQNDGSDADPYTLIGPGTGNGYAVSYHAGTLDITSQVTAGTYQVTLDPTKSKVITLRVTVKSTAAASRGFLVKATSTHDPTRADAVKAVVARQ
jgi:streptogramin lyase